MTPEQKARFEIIDKMLIASGYVLQDKTEFNPRASLGVVVRELATESGPADYIIFSILPLQLLPILCIIITEREQFVTCGGNGSKLASQE